MQVVDETVVLPQFLFVEKIVVSPEVVDISVVTQRLISMVLTVQQNVSVVWSCKFSGAVVEERVVLPQLQLVEKIAAIREQGR